LATGKGTVSGRLFMTDGSMYFPKCSQIWPLAMKGEEDTDCLFREMSNRTAVLETGDANLVRDPLQGGIQGG